MSWEELRVPAFCPLCSVIMKGSISTKTFYDWGCCMHCYIEFVEGREERWRGGWRPTSEEIVRFVQKLDG